MATRAFLASLGFVSLVLFAPQMAKAADDVAYYAIQAHDWDKAETELLAGLRKNPDNVFRLLNLAWVYSQTGRDTQAAAIYERILDSDRDRLAALPSGEPVSAKALAARGLDLLED